MNRSSESIGGVEISKDSETKELEEKLRERKKECPYCDCEMKMGFLVPVFALDWAEYVSTSGQAQDNVIRLSGVLEPVNRLPALHCSECGVLISQVE